MRALARYAAKEVWPRLGRILLRTQTLLAACVVAALMIFADDLALDELDVDKLAAAVLAYAALALGFCLAGLTVALTLPDRAFAQFLADREREARKPAGVTTAYGDLVFVFSWTAMTHAAVIVLTLIALVTLGDTDVPSLGEGCDPGAVLVAVLGGALTYAFFQFVVAILTLSEVANVYIAWIRRTRQDGDGG